MIQLGKRTTRCALLVTAALGVSGNVLAQPAPAPEPAPAPANPEPANPPTDQPPSNPANPANPPAPGAPPVAAQPPVPAPTPPPASTGFPTMAGPALKLSDLFTIRFGVFTQIWASFVQDVFKQSNGDAGDFARNVYLRRARFFLGGTILSPNLTYFMLWESANNGAPVVDATGALSKQNNVFVFNDAYLDFKINPNVSVQAGLFLLPFTRNILQSTSTYWALDIGGVSASYIAATQTTTLRDYGAAIKINAVENHFELRGMVTEGVRLADTTGSSAGTALPPTARNAGKNNPRLTAFAQYNFLDPDTGYVFNGQYFGRKKIAAIAAGVDFQAVNSDNPYFATSLTAAAAIPIHGADPKNGDDEVGGQVEYLHFHGGRTGTPPAGLLKQDAALVELGYYNKAAKISVFGKFEGRFYDDAFKTNNLRIYGVGLKYFIAEQIANLTLMYSLTQFPDLAETTAAVRNDSNALQLQLQVGYF